MKNLILPGVIFFGAAIVAATFVGCGQSNVAQGPSSLFSGTCQGTSCNTNTFTGGDTETFNISSLYALSEYAGMNITSATDVVVNINLAQVSTSPPVYLGQMQIEYNDQNGAQHEGTFVNGTSVFTYRGYSNNVNTLVGSTYRIFFEDPIGAVVLTMANPTGSDTVTTTTGQIWFSNFNAAGAPNPLFQGGVDQNGNYYPPNPIAFCWVIDLGPYDCQNFLVPPSSADKDVPAFGLLGNIPSINLNNALGL